jgi:hypothetical protein
MESSSSLARARLCFPPVPYPRSMTLWKSGYEDFSAELRSCLTGARRFDIVDREYFIAKVTGYDDLGDILFSISRDALVYFFPGFLLHFLAAGTYGNGTFFYNFIRRIQPDAVDVVEFGDPAAYFPYNDVQFSFISDTLVDIYHKYGDEYESFIDSGVEYSSLYACSIARSIKSYWSGRRTYPSL